MSTLTPQNTRLKMSAITGTDTLIGKSAALRDLPKLLDAIEKLESGSVVALDFDGIEIATASYLGGTVAILLKMAGNGQLDRFLLLTGMNRNCLDELKLVLEFQELAALVCESNKGKGRRSVEVVGALDPSYKETFALVSDSLGVTASELHSRYLSESSSSIGVTAWINRLTTLHRMKLIRREKRGREFVFSAIH